MENVTLKERAFKKMEVWKDDVTQLKNQLQHSTEDAKESFENQKIALGIWTDKMKNEFDRVEGIGEEKAKILKGNLEDLRVQAALGRMDSADALHDQQKKINQSIHNLRYSVAKMEKETKGNAKSLLDSANHSLEGYQTKFEMYRIQLNDQKEGAVQSWNVVKDNVTLRLSKMSTQLEEGKEHAADKWEHFSDEMKESWKHLRKAINE
jgi:hypothetical protein